MAEYKAKLLKNGGGKNKIEYSTTEHVIGKWTDGSTLYEKTVDCGALPNSTAKNVSHNISNIEKVIYSEGVGVRSDEQAFLPLSYAYPSTVATYYITKTVISLVTSSDMSNYTHTYVTMRYTKTS